MSAFRDFDAARAEHVARAVTFKVGGEEFTVDAVVPAGILLDLSRGMVAGDDGATFVAFVALWDHLIRQEDQERFAAAIRTVDFAVMYDLVSWLVEEATARPFVSQSSSGPSRSSDTAKSKLAAANGAWAVPST